MARVTVEDCIDKVESPYELVLVAKERAVQLNSGLEPTLDRDNDKNTVISLREIAEETIKVSDLTDSAIHKLRKHVEQVDDGSNIPITKTLLQRSLEIASLEAHLDKQRQIYAKRPRIKRLTSLSTKSSADAYYLNSWRRKIEKIGNLNYPRQASSQSLFGSLRLMVAIRPDGGLKEVKLLETSGHRVLDDAAIHIVRLAAPFAPFPDELRQSTDVLEIVRTWQFRKNRSLRSY